MYTIMYETNHGFVCKPHALTFERRKRKQLPILVGRRGKLAGVLRFPRKAFAFKEEDARRAAASNRELERRKLLAAEGVPVCCRWCSHTWLFVLLWFLLGLPLRKPVAYEGKHNYIHDISNRAPATQAVWGRTSQD